MPREGLGVSGFPWGTQDVSLAELEGAGAWKEGGGEADQPP